MKKITCFYLENCPYCRNARRAVDELLSAHPELKSVEIEWVEESRNMAFADCYPYYYVPACFMGGEKLYECSPGEGYEEIKNNFLRLLESARD